MATTVTLKDEHMQGWEHVAASHNQTVKAYAQGVLDAKGAEFEHIRRSDDAQAYAAKFRRVLALSPERRAQIDVLADELIAEEEG